MVKFRVIFYSSYTFVSIVNIGLIKVVKSKELKSKPKPVMNLKIVICALTLLVICNSEKCKLSRESVWSRYTLTCETIASTCPIHKKTPGIGGVKTVNFKVGCATPTQFKIWVDVNKKVLYKTTRYDFVNCSCAVVCSTPHVRCLECKVDPTCYVKNCGLGRILGSVFGGGLSVIGIGLGYKVIQRFRRQTHEPLPNIEVGAENDGEEEEARESDGDGQTTEVKVVDRSRDSKGRFTKTE